MGGFGVGLQDFLDANRGAVQGRHQTAFKKTRQASPESLGPSDLALRCGASCLGFKCKLTGHYRSRQAGTALRPRNWCLSMIQDQARPSLSQSKAPLCTV